MTWRRFWKLGEQMFDRFNTVGIVILVLDVVNGTALHYREFLACIGIALTGGMLCATFAWMCEPEKPVTSSGEAGEHHLRRG